MKMNTGAAIAAMLLMTGSACSGDGDEDDVASGQAAADMVGCTGWSDTSEELFVSEGGTCELDGEEIGVYYFADGEARDSYVDAGAAFGGNYLVGDSWVVDGDPAVLQDLQADYGGELSAE